MKAETKIPKLKSQAKEISKIVSLITKEKLPIPIKAGGWSINKIVHHIADAHLHAFMRVMWIYTEQNTKLKTFDQDAWVAAPDKDNSYIRGSLDILAGICERWAKFSENLSDEEWVKKGNHPEVGDISIEYIFNYFVDHAESHIAQLRKFTE